LGKTFSLCRARKSGFVLSGFGSAMMRQGVFEQRFTARRMAQEYLHCFETVARTGKNYFNDRVLGKLLR
jgi:hypothetical protein